MLPLPKRGRGKVCYLSQPKPGKMTLHQLVKTHSWPTIARTFEEIYPGEMESLKGYREIYHKLQTMLPEESGLSIDLKMERDDFDGEEYVDVSGIYKNPQSPEEHHPHGLEFVPWRQWLGMDIAKESLANFTQVEIVVHCLREMSFVSFSETEIEAEKEAINKQVGEYKELSEEERAAKMVSWEEIRKWLNDEYKAD